MSKQLIISIGREYGSGGHEIAMKIAEKYGLPLYDHSILDQIAQRIADWTLRYLKSMMKRNGICF